MDNSKPKLLVLAAAVIAMPVIAKPNHLNSKSSLDSLGRNLSQLVPRMLDEQSFKDPSHEAQIRAKLGSLIEQSHSLDFERPSTSVNPVYRFIFPHLKQDMEMVLALFNQGEKPLARQVLIKNTRLCLECHTRRKDTQSQIFRHQPAGISEWGSLKKAQYYGAMWNFAESIRYYESALASSELSQQSSEWQLALKQLISIVIRFQRNPSLVMEMSRVFIHKKTAPADLVSLLNTWSQASESWRKETSHPRTRLAKLERLQELYQLGVKKNQARADSGTIELLRAQNLATALLQHSIFDALYGQSLYWAAKLAESQRDINLWTSESSLFEACIRYQPHTEFARQCLPKVEQEYASLAQLSSRQRLPQLLSLRLQRLRDLAQPER